MKLSIIIPTFNEEATIEPLIRTILETPFPIDYELIIVDDCSTDQTFAIERRLAEHISQAWIRVVRNRANKGKGACIRRGLKHASGEIVVVQDADLEYNPRELPRLLKPFLEGSALAVYGSRFLRHRGRPKGMAWSNYVANRVLTWLTNRLYHLHLSDMETCYKMITKDALERLRLRAKRFEFEPEVTAKLATHHIKIVELPISYRGRTRQQGKKIRAKDFFIAVWTLLRHRFR